jgi:Ribbon-helix-helix protein, copG family
MSANAKEIKIHVSAGMYEALASLAKQRGNSIETFLEQVIEHQIEESSCCAKAMLRNFIDAFMLNLFFKDETGFVKVEFSRDGSFFIDLYVRRKNYKQQ